MTLTLDKNDKASLEHRRILQVFTKNVTLMGAKAMSMSNLAKELSISTKTIYRYFPQKSDLVLAVMDEWNQAFLDNRSERLQNNMTAHDRINEASVEWLEINTTLGVTFIAEIERDFPEAYQLYQQRLDEFLASSAGNLLSQIRDDLNKQLALTLLWKLISELPDQRQCDAWDVTRKQALLQSIDVWAKGSLKEYQ